ncbi:MAG: undecaprenyl-diphosphate phosphatase [Verrucomicrobiota bacterium]
MRKRFLFPLLLLGLVLARASDSAPSAAPAARTSALQNPALSVPAALTLGVVEGVTEFLPVSSTGHLIVATSALGLEGEQPLTNSSGKPLFFEKPSTKYPNGVPLTAKLAADTFTIVIQFGAIAAVALLYWPQLLSMLHGLLGRDTAGRRLLMNVLVAFFPAAVLGLLVHKWIDAHLFSVGAVIAAQVAGALFMWWAEHRRLARRRQPAPPGAALHGNRLTGSDLTLGQAAQIGALQCVAMWPGTSRSMMTIVGGQLAGLDPRGSAEFSFLLGFVTLTAATAYKSWSSGAAMLAVFGWPHVLLGCAVAAITAALSVKLLVNWLIRHGLMLFVWYRLAFAALLAGLLAAGLLR